MTMTFPPTSMSSVATLRAALTRSSQLRLTDKMLRTIPELREYQQFMADFVAAVQDAKKAGKSVDDAASAIDLSAKYKGYQNQRYKAAVQAIYDEIGK